MKVQYLVNRGLNPVLSLPLKELALPFLIAISFELRVPSIQEPRFLLFHLHGLDYQASSSSPPPELSHRLTSVGFSEDCIWGLSAPGFESNGCSIPIGEEFPKWYSGCYVIGVVRAANSRMTANPRVERRVAVALEHRFAGKL
ncbi:hypothetical protein SDJN02_04123, partial [Cucurbita argyrosperma subsp. argyrosperma]